MEIGQLQVGRGVGHGCLVRIAVNPTGEGELAAREADGRDGVRNIHVVHVHDPALETRA